MTIKGVNGYWNVKAEVYEKSGSVNINNNTSVVRVDLYVGRNAGAGNSYIYGNFSGTITVNGSSQSFSGSTGGQKTINAGGYWYTGITKDFTVTHNADGSKSVGVSFSWSANFSPSSASASGTLGLTTIARKTACPGLTGYIKSSYNLTLSPKSSSFTHSLKVVFGTLTKWLQSDGTLGNSEYKFSTRSPLITLPIDLYSQFTAYEGTGTFYLYTYNGSTSLGYNTNTLRAQCNPVYKPEIISSSVLDTNATTIALTGDNNDIIANKSTVVVSITTTAGDSDDPLASITTKTINGNIFTGDTVTFNNATSKDYTIVLTNNRGASMTTLVSAEGIVIPYITPTFNIVSLSRPEPTSSYVNVNYNGNYYVGYFDESETNANSLTITWEYREKGTNSWTSGGSLTPTIDSTNNTYSGTESLGNLFDYRKQYDFRFTIADELNTLTITQTISRGFPIIWWSNDAVHLLEDVYIKDDKLIDYCIESGNDGTWNYNIYASGKCECWMYQEKTDSDMGSKWGDLFIFASIFGDVDYPVTFANPPIEVVNITKSDNACFVYHENYTYNGGYNTTTHSGVYRPAKTANAFGNQTIGVSFYVIGYIDTNPSL